MRVEEMREAFRRGFVEAVGGCDIQDGWPCRTCFFAAMGKLGIKDGDDAHAMWTVQLLLRNKPGYVRGYTITTTPTAAQAEHEERALAWRRSQGSVE